MLLVLLRHCGDSGEAGGRRARPLPCVSPAMRKMSQGAAGCMRPRPLSPGSLPDSIILRRKLVPLTMLPLSLYVRLPACPSDGEAAVPPYGWT